MSGASKAVFLSYASEDADAARRIADALRAAGIEVWFDQSALAGGDAWDAKIRGQIASCALFVPVISANTQARLEGYFRLEWKLAAQRTHTMAEEKAFLLPVVIDDTRDAEASVPAEFRAVQWTRLPGGETPPAFCARVRKLLEGKVGARPPPAALASEIKRPGAAAIPGKSNRWLTPAIAALGVLAAVAIWRPWRTSPTVATPTALTAQSPKDDKSIAVLPFLNQSDDPENTAFFSDGMHEDILTSLANIRDLRVISRTSVMEYRNTTKKIPQIARELGVAYILEGSVRRAGNQVKITGQLIRAANDEHLWAKSYERELSPKEMFGIQAALATEIAAALRTAISPETRKLLERRPTENLAAYDLYLKGRDPEESRQPNLQIKEKLLGDAVVHDPKFAEAWAALAATHAAFVYWEFDHTPQRLSLADTAMAHAIRLSPDSPEVIYFFGRYALLGYRDYTRASEQFQKIIQLQPNNSEAYTSLAFVQRRQGKWPEVLANFRKAAELDPANERRRRTILNTLLIARRWDEAIAQERRTIAERPGSPMAEASLHRLIFKATGSTREADGWFSRLSPEQLASPLIVLERKYWAQVKGDYAEWKRLDALQPNPEPVNSSRGSGLRDDTIGAAFMHAAHGDRPAARALLAKHFTATEAAIRRQPASAPFWSDLALMRILLDQPEQALRDARKAMELLPESIDQMAGPRSSRDMAIVCAWTGRKDLALAELERLLRTPSGASTLSSMHELRFDPAFFPLRGDPRFEALLKDPKNHAPLF